MNSSNYTTTVNNVTWHELAYDIETLENIYKDFTIQSNTRQKMSASNDVGIVLAEIINGDK